jgi:hypothetical protein
MNTPQSYDEIITNLEASVANLSARDDKALAKDITWQILHVKFINKWTSDRKKAMLEMQEVYVWTKDRLAMLGKE